jgi:hypothetical protein
MIRLKWAVVVAACLLVAPTSSVTAGGNQASILWRHGNLFPWEAASYDTRHRSSEERAQMLEKLGFRHYVYLGSADPFGPDSDVNASQQNIDEEIEAMQRHGIDILAWYFWINADDPGAVPVLQSTLESFKRHHIHPDIWITNSYAYRPKSAKEWDERARGRLPSGVSWPRTKEEYENLPPDTQALMIQIADEVETANTPKTDQEQQQRVQQEAKRIAAIVRFVTPYGCRVDIYNHRGWFGMIDNELAILKQLDHMAVRGVGMVYNFAHSRDEQHDDSTQFVTLWPKIMSRVTTVNIAGLSGVEDVGYPSQGTQELAMMRIIDKSGWWGPIGVLVLWKPADTELVLRNDLAGLDWVAAELRNPGSAGSPPNLSEEPRSP